MAKQVVWHGTHTESTELRRAINANCACEFSTNGALLATCASHRMLTESQRILDGLLFSRRMVNRLRHEEFDSVRWLSRSSRPESGLGPRRRV